MKITRRGFLLGTATIGGGLVLGFQLTPDAPIPNTIEGSFQPNAWLQILPDGQVIFQLDKAEMGQGNMTGLASIMAEELDFTPTDMTVQFAGIHKAFRNTDFSMQLTGGSTSIKTGWPLLRHAGAAARAMLIEAAAQTWQVNANTLITEPGKVVNPLTQQRLSYGDLVQTAKTLKAPNEVSLKDPQHYRWLGKQTKRLDIEAKVHTTATFGVDVELPSAKVAVVVRPPYFGGSTKNYDTSALKSLGGNLSVHEIHSGIAIVADTYWQARKAANILKNHIEWDKGAIAGVSNDTIEAAQKAILDDTESTPFFAHQDDNTQQSFDSAKDALKLSNIEYKVGYFHHSPMEPQNASAVYNSSNGQLTIWAPSQAPDIAREVAHHFTGIHQSNIDVKTTFLGGAFGRRGYVDFAGEVAAIAKALPDQAVKLLWSREDDMQHDYYRPNSTHRLSASLDDKKQLKTWQHTVVSNSILNGFGVDMTATLLPSWVPTSIARGIGKMGSEALYDFDVSIAEGANPEYDIAEREIGIHFYDSGIPTGFWRSVAHSYNGFVKEGMVDEMAHLAQADPSVFRAQHLKNSPRLAACLEKVKRLADWNNKGDRKLGVACHASFGAFVAQIVEVEAKDNMAHISKVYCVADVGFALNPNVVEDQLVGGIVYGLTAAIKPHVKIEDGMVIGSNFHDMPVMRMNECPDIMTALIDSSETPAGVGEIAVPPIGAALGNALFTLTQVRQRQMPFLMNLDEISS